MDGGRIDFSLHVLGFPFQKAPDVVAGLQEGRGAGGGAQGRVQVRVLRLESRDDFNEAIGQMRIELSSLTTLNLFQRAFCGPRLGVRPSVREGVEHIRQCDDARMKGIRTPASLNG